MDFEAAAAYWERKDAGGAHMERAALLAEIERFILAHSTCALATACGGFVRCTPIEYSWRDGAFWMFSEGGRKFQALAENREVALAVFDPYEGFGRLGGLQVSGTAELVEPWSGEYLAQVAFRKLPEQALRALAEPMYLIRVTPVRMDFLCSELRQRGLDPRQHVEF